MENTTTKNNVWKILAFISRILIGALFVFSGYVKAVDPLGFKYKLIEYFESMHLGFFEPLALVIAILVIAAELTMGLCLLARVRMQIVAWGVLLFMLFFLFLTFYIAVAGNVVKDCGCFGDALILSNWATFWKNVVSMVFVLIIFYWRKRYEPVAKPLVEWIILIVFYLSTVGVSIYCLRHLQLIDFMAYKVGTNIPESMVYPENAEHDVYKTTYIYSKNGENKEFDETNYPWKDSTWTFVDTKNELIKKGFEPPIHDFSITTTEGDDITDSILNSGKYNFILCSQKVEEANISDADKINAIADYCLISDNCNFFAYTSSGDDAIADFVQKTGAKYPFCIGDETTIKTILRSNPGLMLVQNGNIIAKWAHADIPTVQQVEKLISTDNAEIIAKHKSTEKRNTLILAIIALVAVCAVNFLGRKTKHNAN